MLLRLRILLCRFAASVALVVNALGGAGAAGATSWAVGASVVLALVVGIGAGLLFGRLTVLLTFVDFFGGIVCERAETLNLLELDVFSV
jgi:hypothetical protein